MSQVPERWPEHLRPVPAGEPQTPDGEHEAPPDAPPDSPGPPQGATRQPVPRALPGDGDEPADEPAAGAPEGREGERLRGLRGPQTRYRPDRSIADVIVELGMVGPEAATEAAAEARSAGRPAEEVLLERSLVTEEQIAQAVAERYGHDYVDLGIFTVDMSAASLLSVEAARRYRALPVAFLDSRTVLLAMVDPANVLAVDDIQMMTGHDCRVAVAAPADVETLTARLTSMESALAETSVEEEDEDEALDLTQLRSSADDEPVVKLVHGLLAQAVSQGASDIHMERDEGDMRVRFRVDGVLHEAATVPRRMIPGTISRLKIMSELDIAEKRVPQDGRVGMSLEGRKIDLRVVTVPTPQGEGAVVRILDKSNVLLTLDKLGISGTQQSRFETAFRKPYGAVIVTGPTGSGKSTTLYAALHALNDVEKNIITIEDPVEYEVPGLNQIQVHKKAGLSFAAGLRAMLRADPDVIMVGEIRDAETAKTAIEAALTGHMLLSTLHTNNAPGAITRLSEMGVEPFLTASALDCVVAQRLARKLCDSCKRAVTLSVEALRGSGFPAEEPVEAFEPVGCSRCSSTGYRGRIGVFEVMSMSEEIAEACVQRASGDEIMRIAIEQGMVTLREDGLERLAAGVTSVEEVIRVSS